MGRWQGTVCAGMMWFNKFGFGSGGSEDEVLLNPQYYTNFQQEFPHRKKKEKKRVRRIKFHFYVMFASVASWLRVLACTPAHTQVQIVQATIASAASMVMWGCDEKVRTKLVTRVVREREREGSRMGDGRFSSGFQIGFRFY